MAVTSISGVLQYTGLSTDTKPTSGVPAGSRFTEITLGSPNTIAIWIYDGTNWGKSQYGTDISAVIPSMNTLYLVPQTATGTAVLNEASFDWTTAQDFITIAPATGNPLRDAYLDIDLAKASSGFAAQYAAQTLTLQVNRKTDGTNWHGEAAQSAISGTNAASRIIRIPLGMVSVASQVKVTAKLSAENTGSIVANFPFELHYVAVTGPTVTAAT